MSATHATDCSVEMQLREACAELDRRLRAGDDCRAEEYIALLDAPAAPADFALELIYAEYLARERRGDQLAPAQWFQRFPQFRTGLERLIAVHKMVVDPTHTGIGDGQTPADAITGTAPAVSQSGQRIGQYELLEEIGQGGMGVVYKARQLGLGRTVAVKMIHATQASLERRSRFRSEAELAARLQHPNIVQIHEVGEQDGIAFLSMEYVDGSSLDAKLAGSPLPARAAAEMMERLARAVHFAHQHGIVHRDLKPANILLVSGGVVGGEWSQSGDAAATTHHSPLTTHFCPKITDFGLAKCVAVGQNGGADSSGLTNPGVVLGTPSYMAPEQAAGKTDEVGPLADVYSLGAILYQSLTGHVPFRGETPLATLELVRSQEPVPPRRLQPRLPRDVETICLKCLEKQPGKRYATAEELAADLRRFLDGEPIQARPIPFWTRGLKWARRRPAVATLAALLAAAVTLGFAGVTWQWIQAEESRAKALDAANTANTSRAEAVEAANAADTSRARAVEAAIAADTARLAEQAERERVERLLYAHDISLAYHEYVTHNPSRAYQLLNGSRPELRHWEWRFLNRFCRDELLTLSGHTQPVFDVAFSPDGKWLASASRGLALEPGEVKVWDATTGAERFTLPGHTGFHVRVAFSPDSKRLATTSSRDAGGVRIWDAVDGRELLGIPLSGTALSVAYSPDGRFLAMGQHDGKIVVHDTVTGAEVRKISGHSGNVFDLAFHPDGTLLAAAGRDGVASVWDVSDGRKVFSVGNLSDVRTVAFRPDGRQFALGTWPGFVRIFEVTDDGFQEGPSHPRPNPVGRVVWRPDGSQLAVLLLGSDGIQLWDARTFQWRRTFYGPLTRLAFSPDGRRLAAGGLDRQVRVWDLATEPQPHTVVAHPSAAVIGDFAFSPDGRHLALTAAGESPNLRSRDDHSLKLFDLSLRSTIREFKGHTKWLTGAAFSPDGHRLASSSEDNTVRLWNVSSGEEIRKLEGHTAAVMSVAFSPDGSRVVSASRDKTVRLWDCTTGLAERAFEHTEEALAVAYHSGGRIIASASSDGWIRLWDTGSGERLAAWRGHDGRVNELAFARGDLLVTCGADRTIKLWEVDAVRGGRTEPLRTLHGHAVQAVSIGLSSDGERLASVGAEDRALVIWSVPEGHELLSIRTQVPATSRVRFSPDGRLLMLSDAYHLRIWDSAPKDPQAQLAGDPAAMESDLAWHTQEASSCESAGQWFGAVFHWNQLAAMEPENWQHRARCGGAYTRLEKWDKAATNFDQAVALGADANVWYNRALLCLRADDADGYRATCAGLLDAFGQTDNDATANTVAWTCLLSAWSRVDPNVLVGLTEQAVAQRRDWWKLNTLATALYRAGRFEEAVHAFDEAMAGHGRGGTPHDWLVLAMVHHALGHSDDARQWFDKAAQWIDQAIHQKQSGEKVDPFYTWQHEIELRSLRQEAERSLVE